MKIPEGIEDKHYDNFSFLFEFSALGLHQGPKIRTRVKNYHSK